MRYLYITIIAALIFCSCSDKDLLYDSNDTLISFVSSDSIDYSFSFEPVDYTEHEIKIPIEIVGVPVNYDREYNVVVDDDASTALESEYEIINENFVIAANKMSDTLVIKLIKSDRINNETVKVKLDLLSTSDFGTPPVEKTSMVVNFTNKLNKPSWWDSWAPIFGDFSQIKYKLWINYYKEGQDLNGYYWDNMPYYFISDSFMRFLFPVTFIFVDELKKYLQENEVYDDEGNRVLIP